MSVVPGKIRFAGLEFLPDLTPSQSVDLRFEVEATSVKLEIYTK